MKTDSPSPESNRGSDCVRRLVRRVCRFLVCPKCGTEHWEALRADFAVCLVCDWEYHGPIYHPECTEEKHAAMKRDGWGKCLHCECDLITPNVESIHPETKH